MGYNREFISDKNILMIRMDVMEMLITTKIIVTNKIRLKEYTMAVTLSLKFVYSICGGDLFNGTGISSLQCV